MSEWIKPSELPPNFFGECWVCWKRWNKVFEPKMYTVQNVYKGFPEYYCNDGYYEFLRDEEYRVIVIPTPQIWDGA